VSADAKVLIDQGVKNLQDEVHSLQQLKLVIQLDLIGGRDTQTFRVEVPGPKITKDVPADAKVRMSVPRAMFNVLAVDGRVADWREAFENGHAKADGAPQILKLIEKVVERHEDRERLRRASRPSAGR